MRHLNAPLRFVYRIEGSDNESDCITDLNGWKPLQGNFNLLALRREARARLAHTVNGKHSLRNTPETEAFEFARVILEISRPISLILGPPAVEDVVASNQGPRSGLHQQDEVR